MRKILGFLGALLLGATVGAAGVKITAELKSQKISFEGNISNQEVITYKGSTYVPLRTFGELVGIPVSYKDGIVYLGEDDSKNMSFWEKDIKHMSQSMETYSEYKYNGKKIKDNVGTEYSNYLIFNTSLLDGNIEFPLKGQYKSFEAILAVPDGHQQRSAGDFKILIDGKEVYSKHYSPSDMPEHIILNTTGAQKISFTINNNYKIAASVGLFNGKFIK